MPFQPASTNSVIAFVAIVVAVIVAFLWAVHRAYRSQRAAFIAAAALGAWLGTLGALIASGRMSSLPFSGIPIFFGSILVVCTTAALSPFGGRLATNLPLAALVGFQAFRLPLELVLHEWAAQGTIPETMTWTGQNWDIISGIAALAAAPLVTRFPTVARAANIIGFALLLNVMRVALFSAPVPFGWNLDRPLLVALHLPYAFIGPVCVGGALFGHIVLTRKLWKV